MKLSEDDFELLVLREFELCSPKALAFLLRVSRTFVSLFVLSASGRRIFGDQSISDFGSIVTSFSLCPNNIQISTKSTQSSAVFAW